MTEFRKTGFDNPTFVSTPTELENGKQDERKESIENEDPPEGPQWGNGLEFLMSCIAMSVGLGNIWRFPFIAQRNGGGAFLIPYIIVLILIGRPMYYMEMALGQFTSRGPAKMYSKMAPVLQGIGIGQIVGATCVASYYCVLMAITFHYLINSFTSNFPWATCSSSWNVYEEQRNLVCIDQQSNISDFTYNNTITSAEMYFRREVLKEIDDISDGLGAPDWKLALYLLLAWFVTFLISIKGIKSAGKASYFLAIFPYVVMITLLIRAATLDGAEKGMYYFIETDFSRLKDAEVWYSAVSQCFFSLNVGFGNIISLASYNKFDHNINRDAFIVTTLDTFTSLLSSITVFGILGNLAYEMNIEPSQVISAGGGTGLAFISYPDAISKFEFAPWLFAVVFFVMLFVLGIGSLAALHGNLNKLIYDLFPKTSNWKIAGFTATALYFIGLIYVTPGGQYTLDVVDFFGGTFVIFVCAICEVYAIVFVYGIDNLCLDMEFMTKKKVGLYWRLTWGLAMPVLLVVIFLYFIFTIKPLVYGIDSLPIPIGLSVFGWSILGVVILQLIGWLLYYFYANREYPGMKKITKTFSTENWRPEGRKRTEEWKKFREEKSRRTSGSWITRKLKALIGK